VAVLRRAVRDDQTRQARLVLDRPVAELVVVVPGDGVPAADDDGAAASPGSDLGALAGDVLRVQVLEVEDLVGEADGVDATLILLLRVLLVLGVLTLQRL